MYVCMYVCMQVYVSQLQAMETDMLVVLLQRTNSTSNVTSSPLKTGLDLARNVDVTI